MNEQHRGAYTPQSDAPLAFDARRTRGGGGGQPVPFTLLISGMVLVVLIIAIVFFYRSGVRGADTAAPQLVGAPVAQTKAPAPADQQPSDPAAGLQVYKSEAEPPNEAQPTPRFAPAPETPAPRPAPRPQAPAAVSSAPLPPAQPAQPAQPAPMAPQAPVAAAVKPPPAKSPALPAKPVAVKPPAAKPQVAKAQPAQPAAVPAASPAPAEAAAGGAAWVQIGAFSSNALAEKGWSDISALMGSAMSGKTRRVETTLKDGTTFYRAYVGGFASKAAAQSFCATLKGDGKPCFVR